MQRRVAPLPPGGRDNNRPDIFVLGVRSPVRFHKRHKERDRGEFKPTGRKRERAGKLCFMHYIHLHLILYLCTWSA